MDLPGQDHHVDPDQDLGKHCGNYGNLISHFFDFLCNFRENNVFSEKLISRKKN